MDDPKELEYLKNYKPSIDDLNNKTPDWHKMNTSKKQIESSLLALTIIVKDLTVLLHLRPLSTNDTQDLVNKLNQIADYLTKTD